MLARVSRFLAAISLACFAAAMGAYPGGTAVDPHTTRYSMTQNFLSDLASTQSWSGRSNLASATLAAIGVVVFTLAFASTVAATLRLCAAGVARTLSRMAAVAMVCAGIGLIGAFLVPPDHDLALHNGLAAFALWAGIVACSLFTIATARTRSMSKWNVTGWLLATSALVGLFVMRWGPTLSAPAALTAHVVAQKIAAVLVFGSLWLHRDSRHVLP